MDRRGTDRSLDVADVSRALTYYYDHPDQMARIEQKRENGVRTRSPIRT